MALADPVAWGRGTTTGYLVSHGSPSATWSQVLPPVAGAWDARPHVLQAVHA